MRPSPSRVQDRAREEPGSVLTAACCCAPPVKIIQDEIASKESCFFSKGLLIPKQAERASHISHSDALKTETALETLKTGAI